MADDDPPAVARRRGHGELLAEVRLLLHRDVAALVGGRATDHRHVDRERLVEEVLLTSELDDLNHVLLRARTLLPAAVAGIDEGMETGSGQEPGAAGGHVAA